VLALGQAPAGAGSGTKRVLGLGRAPGACWCWVGHLGGAGSSGVARGGWIPRRPVVAGSLGVAQAGSPNRRV